MSTTTVDEGYDELDDEPGLSGFWILIIFLAVLAVFAGIVYVAYQKGLHSSASPDSDLPVVMASADPVRREVTLEAADPGRPEVDQELNDTTSTRVIAAIDPETDPLANFDADSSTAADRILGTTTPSDTAPAERTPTPTNVMSEAQTPVVAASATPSAPSVNPRASASEPTSPASVQVAEPVPQQTTAPVAAEATHTVQVGAFGSRDEAMEFYGRLMRQHGALVGNQRPEVQVAVVNGKTYNRLWVGAFSNRGDADSYCRQLSAKGQDCLVRKR